MAEFARRDMSPQIYNVGTTGTTSIECRQEPLGLSRVLAKSHRLRHIL